MSCQNQSGLMKKIILFLILLFTFLLPSYSELIKLKSGKVIEAQIIGKGKDYIKVDFKGSPLFYYLKTIQSIDEVNPGQYLAKKEVIHEDNYSLWLIKGFECAVQGDFQEARLSFEESSKENSLKGPSEACLGIIEDFNAGLITKDCAANLFKGIYARMKSQDEEAIGFYKKAIEINPGYPEAYRNLANIYASKGNFKEAVDYYQKFLKFAPDDVDVYYNLGVCSVGLGEVEKAAVYFKKVIQINPNDAQVYNKLGAMYAHLGRFEDSIVYFKKSLDINPNDADIYFNLGIVCVVLGKSSEAINYFQKAVDINPEYAEVYASLGSVYSDLGRYSEARLSLKKAKGLFKDRGDTENIKEVQGYLDKIP